MGTRICTFAVVSALVIQTFAIVFFHVNLTTVNKSDEDKYRGKSLSEWIEASKDLDDGTALTAMRALERFHGNSRAESRIQEVRKERGFPTQREEDIQTYPGLARDEFLKSRDKLSDDELVTLLTAVVKDNEFFRDDPPGFRDVFAASVKRLGSKAKPLLDGMYAARVKMDLRSKEADKLAEIIRSIHQNR